MSCEQLLAAEHPIARRQKRVSEHLKLAPEPGAPRAARNFVRELADDVAGERLDDVLVLTSELATNAVLHARTPLEVGIVTTDDVVLICVADGHADDPSLPTPSDSRESGRGIMLVRALADDWGVLPDVERGGKVVWFQINRSGSGAGEVAGD
jgi:anti-sigma regulatory factor (Ser/Thr protein kinase)